MTVRCARAQDTRVHSARNRLPPACTHARESMGRARALVHGRVGACALLRTGARDARVLFLAHGRFRRACALARWRPVNIFLYLERVQKYVPIFCVSSSRMTPNNLFPHFAPSYNFSFNLRFPWRLSPLHAWRPGFGALLLLFQNELRTLSI